LSVLLFPSWENVACSSVFQCRPLHY
jgi:hypothetical protein